MRAMRSDTTQQGTVEQLRAAIDSGRTGDKIPFPDPAAVPLGGDEEAAGTPLSREQVSMAMKNELLQRQSVRRPGDHGIGAGWVLVAIIVGAALMILGWGLTLL